MSDFRADMQRQNVTWPCNCTHDFQRIVLKDAQDSNKKVNEQQGAIRMRSRTIRKIAEEGPY